MPRFGAVVVRMSMQHFLMGRIDGVAGFVTGERLALPALVSRCRWMALLSEVAPRALLAELGLSPLLLGTVAGTQFLLVLPGEFLERAEAWLEALAGRLEEVSGGQLRLLVAHTENLGAWAVVQRRLEAALRQKRLAPGRKVLRAEMGVGLGERAGGESTGERRLAVDESIGALLAELREPASREEGPRVEFALEAPVMLRFGKQAKSGATTWGLQRLGQDRVGGAGAGGASLALGSVPVSGTVAVDAQRRPSTEILQQQAKGRKRWGILVADLDNVRGRLEGLGSVEEYLQASLSLQSFVAGEVEFAASKGALAGQMTVLYAGGDDFAVAGPWDKLLEFVSQMRRLFDTFLQQAGGSGGGLQRTISAAIAVAEPGESAGQVLARCRQELETVKASGKNAIFLFESILDWPQLQEAATLRTQMARLMERHAGSADFLVELEEFYAGLGGSGVASARGRRRGMLLDKPWRLHRNLRLAAKARESSGFEKDWQKLFATMTAVGSGGRRELRPTGRVAIEWTRLHTGRG